FKEKTVPPPLYTLQDAHECLQQVRGIEYDREFAPRVGVRARFRDAGHILGSAIVEVWITEYGYPTKIVFSGDLGQPGRPILRDPTTIEEADILVIESTCGNRRHKDFSATEADMIGIVEKTLFERGGNVIVPAFAVGRTQEVLYHLRRHGEHVGVLWWAGREAFSPFRGRAFPLAPHSLTVSTFGLYPFRYSGAWAASPASMWNSHEWIGRRPRSSLRLMLS
ncbi:MBL fold metallo-hydrolase, partial [Castellaniella sp.]|uniref:MBL fold metallo-hydrolase n=1 Tax=Castellaniella sp. TaxID=1955812 RepID=UPI0035672FB8